MMVLTRAEFGNSRKGKKMKRVLGRQIGRELTRDEQKMVGGALGDVDLVVTTWVQSDLETETSHNGGPASDCDMMQDYHSFD